MARLFVFQGRPDRSLEADHDPLQRSGRWKAYHGDTCGLRAARERHPFRRPLLQVSPPARHPGPRLGRAERAARRSIAAPAGPIPTTGRRWSRRSTASPSLRRTTGRRSISTSARSTTCSSPVFVAGFYYKTFMWPRSFWDKRLRAAHPRRRRPRPRAGRSRTPTATRPPRPLRRAGGRRRAGRPRRRAGGLRERQARHPRRRAGRARRLAAARRDVDDRRRAGAATGLRRRSTTLDARENVVAAAAHDGVRLLQPQPRRAGRAGDRPPARSRAQLAARAALAGARRRGGAGDRRARAPAGLRRQRPARHHAGGERARVRQPLRGRAGPQHRHRHSGASAYQRRPPTRKAAGLAVASSTCARRPNAGRKLGSLRAAGLRGSDRPYGRRRDGPQARHGLVVAPLQPGWRRRPASDAAVRLRRHVRRLDAGRASLLAVARQAALRPGASTPSCPATSAQAERSAGAARRHLRSCANASRRAGRRAPAPLDTRASAAFEATPTLHRLQARARSCRPTQRPPAAAPSSISRTTSPRRTSSSRCARASNRSSTSSATRRPAWRPTRARRRT